MDKVKLKPCPFCGCTEVTFVTEDELCLNSIQCKNCPCSLSSSRRTLADLIQFWNRRVANERI